MVLIVVILAVWKIPQRQLAPLKAKIQRERNSLQPQDRLKLESDARKLQNDARTALIQAIGGLALLIGLYFTAKTLRTTQEGQITDRFSKAINQLGETGPENLAIRLGGIYALERIAKDSERDHWPMMEILTAYVREHAPRKEEEQNNQLPWGIRPKLAADIQAILMVIGRRARTYGKGEDHPLNLTYTDLRGAYLWEAPLEGAFLSKSCLDKAILAGTHLEGASLREAHLEGVELDYADLTGANLYGASLTNASINRTCLAGANLQRITAEGFIQITPEQISILPRGILHKAILDPGLQHWIQQYYPHLADGIRHA
jgi:hypothetical protein